MEVNFTITTKNPTKLSEALVRDTDPIFSGGINFYFKNFNITDSQVTGIISFDPSYQPSDFYLKDTAERTIKSALYSYAFVNFDNYSLDLYVNSRSA